MENIAEKILYVDDEKGNCDYFRSAFRREFSVLTALSGMEALDTLVSNEGICVIITDQRMPKMSGVEFLEKSLNVAPEAVRILVTGYSDMSAVIDAINKGQIYHYISKPWTYDEMKIIIKKALEAYKLRIENKTLTSEKEELIVKTERQEKEYIRSQLENLRKQLNPHFLFNCLNTLHAMVPNLPDARRFIQKLSTVYRYLLEHNDENLVTLDQEVGFLDNYVYLQKERFKDALLYHNRIYQSYFDWLIPSVSGQLLVENSIKHNIVSKENPLEITVYIEDEFLVVKNNFQPKSQHEPSTRVGQENLRERLRYLTNRKPMFMQLDNFYYAKIPILKSKA